MNRIVILGGGVGGRLPPTSSPAGSDAGSSEARLDHGGRLDRGPRLPAGLHVHRHGR